VLLDFRLAIWFSSLLRVREYPPAEGYAKFAVLMYAGISLQTPLDNPLLTPLQVIDVAAHFYFLLL